MLDIDGVKCTHCNQVIYSRATHDFHGCKCGSTFIDGGFEYTKVSGDSWVPYPLQLNVTKKRLINDWRYGTDKFGWYDLEE